MGERNYDRLNKPVRIPFFIDEGIRNDVHTIKNSMPPYTSDVDIRGWDGQMVVEAWREFNGNQRPWKTVYARTLHDFAAWLRRGV